MTARTSRSRTTIVIGGVAIGLSASDDAFVRMLEDRYAGFVDRDAPPDHEFDVELGPPLGSLDDEIRVVRDGAGWRIRRGDFLAEWDPSLGRGSIRQSPNPYSLDSVLRIVHTLVLAQHGGFLVHASSAIRNERAYLFAGVSGSGKTTLARLAPFDVDILTDEISYVRREAGDYVAYGTPFSGELGKPGANVHAPLAALYVLSQGPENRIDAFAPADALRALMTNVLFFAEDPALVRSVFHSAAEFVERIPVRQLTFAPDARVWDLIGGLS